MNFDGTTSQNNIKLLVPESENNSDVEIEISIVVPALNEELTIGEFVDWCWEGLKKANKVGEVLIIDSSSDNTPLIALSKGARVLRTPKGGLGKAYLDSIPFIRGKFLILGDCDLTYDFREIQPFINAYDTGADFVMGSRFSGKIEAGAMPGLHRYFGTPFTTWILNKLYASKYTDIHCGMRGLTKDAFIRLQLTSRNWEYASEMVLKAARLNLNIKEVPVNFYKDREGRVSHHKRMGFLSPWIAGWINLKVMLVYSADTFLIGPGIISFTMGALLMLLESWGNVKIGPIVFNLHTWLLGFALVILGNSFFQAGILARSRHQLKIGILRNTVQLFSYDRGMFIAASLFLAGFSLDLQFLMHYLTDNFTISHISKLALLGLLLMILAAQTFTFTLTLELSRRLNWINERSSQ
jgi:glycosyltransferase involved in cell wall biosynthesis